MNTAFLAVLWKEVIDGLRDRRSLVAALLFSFFGPLVLAGALIALADQKDVQDLELPVAGGDGAPELISFLAANEIEVTPAPADPEGAVRRRELKLALRIDPAFAADAARFRPAKVEVLYDSSRRASREAAQRVEEVLRGYARATARARLLARGVAPSAIEALALERRDFSTPGARAAMVLGMLPIFLLMAAFMAGMNLAIDATAGERERGSLEALLVHPVSRQALAWGKWLAVALFAALGTLLTLFVAELTLSWERVQSLDLAFGLEGADLATLVALLLPVALLAPSLQLVVALFSHNFKEAQTYLSLIFMLPTLPGFYFSFTNREPASWMDWVPLLGHQVAITRVISGEAVGAVAVVGLGAATVALALGAVSLTGWLLGQERIALGR